MHTCPVCGFPKLNEPPRSPSGGGSYEICPSCGFQFGVDDDDKGVTFDQWRERWVAAGSRWSSKGITAPKGWDAKAQLKTLAKSVAKPAKKAAKKAAKKTKR